MKGERGQTSVEWLLVASVVVLGMAFILLSARFNGRTFSEIIGEWYAGAGAVVARAGIKNSFNSFIWFQ